MSNQTDTIFTQLGGVFTTPAEIISEKMKVVKAFVFDWDGVFNNAVKNDNKSSNFNEADSMGTNMLRYNYFYHNNKMPVSAIISGEKNEMALYFCQREHFDASYYKIPNKIIALQHLCEANNINVNEVCYMFDDVLDLSIAEKCGVRILINRKANPLFKNYVIKNNLADYVTAHESGNFAVREACEMLIGLTGTFDNIMKERTLFSENYTQYITKRQTLPTSIFTVDNGEIILTT
ncbi:MAG: phosphatase [Bacteroidetes bacterium]|nr:phosphatase [Bacteroidota bacterium]